MATTARKTRTAKTAKPKPRKTSAGRTSAGRTGPRKASAGRTSAGHTSAGHTASRKTGGSRGGKAAKASIARQAAFKTDTISKVKAPAAGTPAPGMAREGLNGPDPKLMKKQAGIWNTLMDRYFRLEFAGFERLPEEPVLMIGVHSGGPLTMDAWTVIMAWWRQFGETRSLHGTAHDVLMKAPVLGEYFRRLGVLSPSRENLEAAFAKGDDVILWPGGELDSYRNWTDRDKAVLGGRKGFIRLAMRAGVPIVPVATVGGHDTLFVLSEGRGLAKALKLKERMRSDVAPITLSWPFGLALHLTPFQHIPLPAKIRTQILDPIYLDTNPARLDDQEYVDAVYDEIEARIQAGMDKLAKRRKLPIFG